MTQRAAVGVCAGDLYVANNKGDELKSYITNSIKARTRPSTEEILNSLYDKIAQVEGRMPHPAPALAVRIDANIRFDDGPSASASESASSSVQSVRGAAQTLRGDSGPGVEEEGAGVRHLVTSGCPSARGG
eukprot:3008853-Rhodomonas_salina.3